MFRAGFINEFIYQSFHSNTQEIVEYCIDKLYMSYNGLIEVLSMITNDEFNELCDTVIKRCNVERMILIIDTIMRELRIP